MDDRNRLKNRVAIVTGGGRGLGREMALGLSQAGAKVIITAAKSRQEIEAVAGEAQDGSIIPIMADVTSEADCLRLVGQTEAIFGPVDILVNNAGRGMRYVSERFFTEPTRFWECDPATWRMVIATNVDGPFLMACAVVPSMIERHWGRIINISMNHETMRRRGFSPYGPSKAALESETIIWAQDLQGTGVTVNALLPGGATRTGMIPEGLSDEARRNLLDPQIIVAPLLWLASETASAVTGKRLNASRWNARLDETDAAAAAIDSAGWVV
jgi:NAD(P)-dependent dehydrogenase (short-subunit alcohol dehydrogenase family)